MVKPDQFQQQVIDSRAPGIRVVAPAGSGKTETLVWRAIDRIEKKDLLPRQLLVLSFDNSAKRTFEQKFRRYAPKGVLPEVRTLNSFGNSILREYAPEVSFTVDEAKNSVVRNRWDRDLSHLEILHWDGRHRRASDVFDAIKNQGYSRVEVMGKSHNTAAKWLKQQYFRIPTEHESISVAELMDLDDDQSADQLQEDIDALLAAYAEFYQELIDKELMEFSDQKLRANEALRASRKVRDSVQAKYLEIMVDECQDIGRLDATLIYRVTGPNTTLVLAGDDDQSLYAFREANSTYLRDPHRYFKDHQFETVHLGLNYRTPEAVLAPALAMVSHNRERLPKSPKSAVPEPGGLSVLRAASNPDLMEQVVTWVESRLTSGTTPGDMAILCTQDQYVATQRAIRRAGISQQSTADIARSGTDAAKVTVATMMSAKGQQWPIVILPHCSDEHLPGPDALRLGDLEPQRRMLYVAMTRASDRLVIGYACEEPTDVAYSTSTGQVRATNGASRFLFEAGIVYTQTEAASQETFPAGTGTLKAADQALPEVSNTSAASQPSPEPRTTSDRSPAEVSSATIHPSKTAMLARSKAYMPQAKLTPPLADAQLLRAWDLREEDRAALDRATEFLAKEPPEYSYAMVTVFSTAIRLLQRNIPTEKVSGLKPSAVDTINAARTSEIVDRHWYNRLTAWRKARNRYAHPESEVPLPGDPDLVHELVSELPRLCAHIGSRRVPAAQREAPIRVKVPAAPPPTTPDAHRAILLPFQDPVRNERISQLADHIQSRAPIPSTGKIVKALKFNPEIFREEMLILQLHLLLRDVRFHIAEQYRWSGSPEFESLVVSFLGGSHQGVRPVRSHGLATQLPKDGPSVVEVLREVVISRFPDNPAGALRTALSDAHDLNNGNYATGFKIRAYRT